MRVFGMCVPFTKCKGGKRAKSACKHGRTAKGRCRKG